jgi:hypothetical protein
MLTVGATVFLLFAFGGYSPLYRALFNVLPYLSKIRAMGMVFFLSAFFLSVLAGIGLDHLLSGKASARKALIVAGAFAFFALLGVTGALQSMAVALASPERASAAQMNAGELQSGSVRLLLFTILSAVALWLIVAKRVVPLAGTAAILLLSIADLWSVDREFYEFSPRAGVLFRNDSITTYLSKVPKPYRVLDAGNAYLQSSILMAYGIPSVLGYHGFELRAYDELGGKSNGWQNLLTPNVLDLLSVRFLILGQSMSVPGFHEVVAPTTTAVGNPAVLYEKDSIPDYARVMLSAAKVPEDQEMGALVNPRFPFDRVALYADTSTETADSIVQPVPKSAMRASVSTWAPGRMTVSLSGADARPGHLVIAENWYPDWHATVDGKTAIVRRVDHALLGVDVPPGSRQVELWFDSATYARGKWLSTGALLVALLMIAIGVTRERRVAG